MNFENWYTKMLNETNVAPATTVEVDVKPLATDAVVNVPSREDIISDVDSIMTQLDQLSAQVKEALEYLIVFENKELNKEELNEDRAIFELTAGEAGSKIADWIYYAPKYRKAQQKINKMKMNALDVQLAIDLLGGKAEDAPKRDALKAKKSNMDAGIKDLQSEVDTKARERGEYIGKVLSAERIKGKIELVKRASGQEDNPSKKKELVDSFRELNKRFAEEQAAIKQLQDEEKEKEAAQKAEAPVKSEPKKDDSEDEIKKPEPESKTEKEPASKDGNGESDQLAAAQKATDDKKDTEKDSEEAKKKKAERAANKEDDTKNAEKETTKNTKDGKLDRVEDMIKKETEKVQNNPEAKKIKDKIAELEGAIEELKNKENKSKEDADKISMIQKGIEAQKKQLDKVSSSDKLQKLKDLKDQIAAKENWQLEGTELGRLFEMEISKLEKEYMINESRFLSVSDKFKLLMG